MVHGFHVLSAATADAAAAAAAAERVVGRISAPVYKAIRRWVWDGEIDDPRSVLILEHIGKPNHA